MTRQSHPYVDHTPDEIASLMLAMTWDHTPDEIASLTLAMTLSVALSHYS